MSLNAVDFWEFRKLSLCAENLDQYYNNGIYYHEVNISAQKNKLWYRLCCFENLPKFQCDKGQNVILSWMASTQLQCSSYKQYFFIVGKFRSSMLCLHCLKRATKFLMQVILYDVYFLKLSLFAVHRVTPIYSTPNKRQVWWTVSLMKHVIISSV